MHKRYKAWNKAGKRLTPGGKKVFNAATLKWLRTRKQGVGRVKVVIPPKPMRLRALNIARTEIGIMEHGGNNSGRQVMAIIRENGGTGPEPWCGNAVAHWYRLAGAKSVRRAWAAVRYLGRVGGMKSINARSMKPGDIVVYSFDHCGILDHYADHNGERVPADRATHIIAIEGNTGASGAVSDSKTGGDGIYKKIRNIGLVSRGVRVLK